MDEFSVNSPSSVYVGLGSNQQQPTAQIENAVANLSDIAGTSLREISSQYRTPAWGMVEQPDFINAVARVETLQSPIGLLRALHSIERDMGRVRRQRWAARVIDLDVLLFGALRITSPEVIIPHPWLVQRPFALVPLLEIAPNVRIPGFGPAAAALLKLDPCKIVKL